jgi:RNA polymerase sigma factor (sigma-70 family)
MSASGLRIPAVTDVGTRFAADDSLRIVDRFPALVPVLRSYLRRWVPLDDVDDVVQAVLLDLWRTRARYDPARSLEAWSLSIARRRAIDHLRARPRPAAPLADLAEPPGEDGRDLAARLADAAEIRGALSALPPPQREAIEMAYYGQLSQREIAERLRVPIGTIKARTARGLRAARQILTSAAASGQSANASGQSAAVLGPNRAQGADPAPLANAGKGVPG